MFNRPTVADVLHGLGVAAATAAIFAFGFYLNPSIPSTFMLTLTVVWCAIRFNLVVTAAHSLITGAATVVMTILGYGPIAEVGNSETRALLAETFVVVLMVISMTIALTRRQFFTTIDSLQRSESALAMRANELDMVMSHLDDGVAIIEEGGRVLHANAALLTAFGSRARTAPRTRPRGTTNGRARPSTRTGDLWRTPRTPSIEPWPARSSRPRRSTTSTRMDVFRVLECSAFPVPTPEDAPQRVMIVLRDVTAASNFRESLVSFAGTVAHDLNNPLSVIDGWAEALEEDLGSSRVGRCDARPADGPAHPRRASPRRVAWSRPAGPLGGPRPGSVVRAGPAAQHGQAHRRHPRPPARRWGDRRR